MGGRFTIDAIFRAVDRMTIPIGQMQARVSKFASATSKNLSAVQKVTSDVHGGLMSIASVSATAGLAAGFAASKVLETGANFDQAMADVAAVSLMTRDQIQDLEAKARELGETTKFTAFEAAQAMELMGKAGFTNAQVLASIDGLLAAAAAEGAELSETASHVSNALKGMGLEADQAGRVADVLALASARTNSSIGSLGESLANVSSTARQFKIPLEQVVGSVALLQDVGLDASVAGSALNTMLTQLAAPSKKAQESMQRLKIKFKDAHGNMLPLTKVFDQFLKAMSKSKGNMDSVAFFAELVGLRGQKAAQNLADLYKTIDPTTGQSRAVSLFEELAHATDGVGAATMMANIRMDTFKGDVLKLNAAVEGLKIELFDLNRGPLRDVTQATAKWIGANKELIKSNVQQRITWMIDHLPEIVTWTERIGKGLLVFYSFAAAVKVAKVATESYLVTARGFTFVAGSIRSMAVAVKLFNEDVHVVGEGLASWRARLNAGELSMKINGVTSALGKAGLLGAAGAIGVAFGLWVREVLNTDKVISDLLLKIRGLEAERAPKLPAHQQEIVNGIVVDTKTGAWVNKPMEGATSATYDKWFKKFQLRQARAALGIGAGEESMSKGQPGYSAGRSVEQKPGFLFGQTGELVPPRVQRTVEETTTTDKAEVTISDETGRAQVTKKPKSIGLKLQQTGR